MRKPKTYRKAPYVMEVKPGTHHWRIGEESANPAYCYESHAESEFNPV